MTEYRLAPEAENDLAEIAIYTLERWGSDQVRRYEAGLIACIKAIASGTASVKHPLPHRPEIVSLHCQHHYVLALLRPSEPTGIIAVLHEQMDLPRRLQERLNGA